jgi:DNA-binding NarL/FixJ family response regulator
LRTLRDQWFDEVRKFLGDEDTAAFVSAGQMMTTDEAVAYALQAPESQTSDEELASWSPLTSREQQVAKLVARGLSNRQIASELIVTEATAAKHVENIREKLGLSSRIQVGVWVRDREVSAPLTS